MNGSESVSHTCELTKPFPCMGERTFFVPPFITRLWSGFPGLPNCFKFGFTFHFQRIITNPPRTMHFRFPLKFYISFFCVSPVLFVLFSLRISCSREQKKIAGTSPLLWRSRGKRAIDFTFFVSFPAYFTVSFFPSKRYKWETLFSTLWLALIYWGTFFALLANLQSIKTKVHFHAPLFFSLEKHFEGFISHGIVRRRAHVITWVLLMFEEHATLHQKTMLAKIARISQERRQPFSRYHLAFITYFHTIGSYLRLLCHRYSWGNMSMIVPFSTLILFCLAWFACHWLPSEWKKRERGRENPCNKAKQEWLDSPMVHCRVRGDPSEFMTQANNKYQLCMCMKLQ